MYRRERSSRCGDSFRPGELMKKFQSIGEESYQLGGNWTYDQSTFAKLATDPLFEKIKARIRRGDPIEKIAKMVADKRGPGDYDRAETLKALANLKGYLRQQELSGIESIRTEVVKHYLLAKSAATRRIEIENELEILFPDTRRLIEAASRALELCGAVERICEPCLQD